MKKLILIIVLLSNNASAACMCSADLIAAFTEIENHIFTQNVTRMNTLLETTNEKVQDNIDALKDRIVIYTKHIKINTLYLKEMMKSVKDEKTLIKVDK